MRGARFEPNNLYLHYFPKFAASAAPTILNIFVPHEGQVPEIACLLTFPLPFIGTNLGPSILTFFFLHLTQYPV